MTKGQACTDKSPPYAPLRVSTMVKPVFVLAFPPAAILLRRPLQHD